MQKSGSSSSDTEKAISILKNNFPEIAKALIQVIGIGITCMLGIWKLGTYFSELTAEIKSLREGIIELKVSHGDLSHRQESDHDRIIRLETKAGIVDENRN